MVVARRADWPWSSAGLLLICLMLGAWPDADHLAWERGALAHGQLWRAWTGHLVHYSAGHLLFDGGALLLVGAAAERCLGWRFVLMLALAGAPLLSLVLFFLLPDLNEYRGASALATALALAAGTALWRQRADLRVVLLALATGLALGLVLEALALAPGLSVLPEQIRVVWQAHALGAVLGWAAARLAHSGIRDGA